MGELELKGTTKGALSKTKLHDGPIVPEVGGFVLRNCLGKKARSFDYISLLQELDSMLLKLQWGTGARFGSASCAEWVVRPRFPDTLVKLIKV